MKGIFKWVLWIVLNVANIGIFLISRDAASILFLFQLIYYSWFYYVFRGELK